MEHSTKRTLFWLAAILIPAISVFIIIKTVAPAQGQSTILKDPLTLEDWTRGDPSAKIVLVEYSDFQCPACSYYAALTKSLIDEFGGHMVFAYRHFPLKKIHENSILAAQAAEAAGLQGKFWGMHDMLFDRQNQWSSLDRSALENRFVEYSQELGLDTVKFLEDMKSSDMKDKVDENADSGDDMGMDSTPTFFLNGIKIQNPRTLEDFRSLIRKTIEQNT